MEVHLTPQAPLQALDISATGLLIEHASPFKPGSLCQVELRHAGRMIRLRVEVVRCVVTGGGRGSRTGIRYRTAFHFVESPPHALFAIVGELPGS